MKLHFLSSILAALLISQDVVLMNAVGEDHGLTNYTLDGKDRGLGVSFSALGVFGKLLSLSPDGKVLAVKGNCKPKALHAHECAALYQMLPNGSWTPMGETLRIPQGGLSYPNVSYLGSIALSQPREANRKGTRVVLGDAGANNFAGAIVVYSWDGKKWVQVGDRIEGTRPSVIVLGDKVSISSDGSRVAADARGDKGEVYILNTMKRTTHVQNSSC